MVILPQAIQILARGGKEVIGQTYKTKGVFFTFFSHYFSLVFPTHTLLKLLNGAFFEKNYIGKLLLKNNINLF